MTGCTRWRTGSRATASNSDYWYRRAGTRRRGGDLEAEWAHQVADLGG